MYNLHSHVYGLHFLTCAQEQGRKINAMRRAIRKRAQRCLDIEYGEVSLQYEFATLPPKTTTSYEME